MLNGLAAIGLMKLRCRFRTVSRRLAGSSPGFAAVDALVALTMLSSTLILALGAVTSAHRAAAAAFEAQRAHALIDHLMSSARPSPGAWSGAERDLEWRLELTVAPDPSLRGHWPLCRRLANLSSTSSGRRYGAATLEACALGEAS